MGRGGGAGKTRAFSVSQRKFLPQNKKKEKSFWFLIPRGALVLFILQNFIRVYHDRE